MKGERTMAAEKNNIPYKIYLSEDEMLELFILDRYGKIQTSLLARHQLPSLNHVFLHGFVVLRKNRTLPKNRTRSSTVADIWVQIDLRRRPRSLEHHSAIRKKVGYEPTRESR